MARISKQTEHIELSLDAVVFAVTDDCPRLLCVTGADDRPRLPSGALLPTDRTLDTALRRFVSEQAGLDVGYAEQLYTFGDLDRAGAGVGTRRQISVAYLALVHQSLPAAGASWLGAYDLLPWEDHRSGRPPLVDAVIAPALERWAAGVRRPAERALREERVEVTFGLGGAMWDGVRVLERYELLFEAGLLSRSRLPGADLALDHRRILATALGRLRGKLTYRPVVFELLPPAFTLLQLQHVVEALAGVPLHKQNFRRLVESAGLVEGTGVAAATGGRPAELFRFRRDVVRERPRPGVGTPWSRGH